MLLAVATLAFAAARVSSPHGAASVPFPLPRAPDSGAPTPCECVPVPSPPVAPAIAPADLVLQTTKPYEIMWAVTNVHSTDGSRDFGVVFAVYAGSPGNDTCPSLPLGAWVSLADVKNNHFMQASKLLPNATSTLSPYFYGDDEWYFVQAQGAPDWSRQTLAITTSEFSVNLSLAMTANGPLEPMAFNGIAFPNVSACTVFHVEALRVGVSGTVTTLADGVTSEVEGLMRYQHIFGGSNAGMGFPGHYWLSQDFSDGWSAQFVYFFAPDTYLSYGNLVSPHDGTNYGLQQGDFNITAGNLWTSPKTGRQYPTTCRLVVPAHGIDVVMKVWMQDNELLIESQRPAFYEAAASLAGTHAGVAITGTGFFETWLATE